MQTEAARTQLHEAIEAVADGFALFDAEDRLVMCNSVYRRYFAVVADKVVPGTPWSEFFRAGVERGLFGVNAETLEAEIARTVAARRGGGTVERRVAGDRWLRITNHPTADGGLVGVYLDVTDLKQRQQELQALVEETKAARTQLHEAIEAVSEGFVLYDAEDRLVIFNSRFRDFLFDVGDAVEVGKTFEAIIRAAADQGLIPFGAGGKEAWIADRLAAHRDPRGPRELRLSNGRWVKTSERKTGDGGVVGVYTDITELKEREVQLGELVDSLAQARDQAMEATRTKSQFLANMSHELRTPLNAVIGLAEMLHEDAEDLGQVDFIEPLERINRAGKHLLNLINEILDLSKIEAGKIEMVSEDFDVAGMIGEVGTMGRPLAEKNNNTLTIDVADDVGSMHADTTRVRQVVFNLLSNACKFTEKGQIGINIRRLADPAGDSIAFAVTDTGIGITEEQMSRLFREFSQADASTTRKYGGTGLGLTISRRLCQVMGGDIDVESELGVGTTFTATIPARVPDIVERSEDTDPVTSQRPPAARKPQSNVVLVIDDDDTVRELMVRHLARDGIEVITAATGEAGIKLARARRPGVITLDVLMPKLDGWEVLRRLKSDPELAAIPVVMVTILDDKSKGYALGVSVTRDMSGLCTR